MSLCFHPKVCLVMSPPCCSSPKERPSAFPCKTWPAHQCHFPDVFLEDLLRQGTLYSTRYLIMGQGRLFFPLCMWWLKMQNLGDLSKSCRLVVALGFELRQSEYIFSTTPGIVSHILGSWNMSLFIFVLTSQFKVGA